MSKKKLNTESVVNELEASSFFTQSPALGNVAPVQRSTPTPRKRVSQPRKKKEDIDIRQRKMVKDSMNDITTSRSQDVKTDVKASASHGFNKALWKEILITKEARNSSLRLSADERIRIEDALRDLSRKYKVDTSMNDIARLGLLFLIHDLQQNGEESIIIDVLKS